MTSSHPWLSDIWSEWQSSLENDTFSNAALLISQPGLATEELVAAFSRAVLCGNYVSDACGVCHSCQLMNAHNHPDYHVINPEKAGKSISVDQIRTCNRLAQESSQLSGKRLFVIEPAEVMTESATNALLKTLEEPSSTCMFLLVTYQPQRLLSTVTSRCQKWQIPKPSSQVIQDWLTQQYTSTIPAYFAHINDNAPTRIQSFIEKEQEGFYQQIERGLLDCVMHKGDLVYLAKLLESAKEDSLRWIWYMLTDAQKVHFGLDAPYLTPGSKVLAQNISYEKLYRQAESLSRLTDQLREHSGLNGELLILDWLIKFNEEVCS